MFSNKFIRLPIRVHNPVEEELMGDENEVETYEMVNPFTISSYRPSIVPDGMTHISFKDGSGMIVYMGVKDFETYMDKHEIFK